MFDTRTHEGSACRAKHLLSRCQRYSQRLSSGGVVLVSLQTASVSGSRLRLAMNLGGFATFAALDEASGVSSDTLRGWAKGRVERPSSQSREAIEDALPVTFEFLTDQAQMPQVHSVNFRSLRSADDRARSKLRAYMAVMAWVVQKHPRSPATQHRLDPPDRRRRRANGWRGRCRSAAQAAWARPVTDPGCDPACREHRSGCRVRATPNGRS